MEKLHSPVYPQVLLNPVLNENDDSDYSVFLRRVSLLSTPPPGRLQFFSPGSWERVASFNTLLDSPPLRQHKFVALPLYRDTRVTQFTRSFFFPRKEGEGAHAPAARSVLDETCETVAIRTTTQTPPPQPQP